MTRFFTARFGGVRQQLGPASGLSYTFSSKGSTPVDDERDAEIFLHMGTPESGVYLYRETDSAGDPIGPFPPIDIEKRQSMIDPKRFPSDRLDISVQEWRMITEDLADPTLYFHLSRVKLNFGRNNPQSQ
jgi:hypothetical protein